MNVEQVEELAKQLFGSDAPSINDLADLAIEASRFVRNELRETNIPADMHAVALLQVLLIAAAQTQAAFSTPATWPGQAELMRRIALVVQGETPEEIH